MAQSDKPRSRWYVSAKSSRADERTRVLKHGEIFGVFDRFGDIVPAGRGEQGLYYQGTRFLSQWRLSIDGQRPMLLNSTVRQDNSVLAIDLTTPDLYRDGKLAVCKGEIHLFRAKVLWDGGCYEHLRIANYGETPFTLRIGLEFGADFADIFEVRGFQRERRGRDQPPEISDDGIVLGYEGLDGVLRTGQFHAVPTPARIEAGSLEYRVELEPGRQQDIYLSYLCAVGGAKRKAAEYDEALAAASDSLHAMEKPCALKSSNRQFDAWVNRSAADLAMLTADNPEGCYPYAGVPWYSTPFGRDSILTALEYLWIDPRPARGVLAFLAKTQATEENPEEDAEPGKIIHELRKGELARLGEIPFGRYYGSIDSTPLFLILAAAYHKRTGDIDFLRGLWHHIEAGLKWIDKYGDADGDGFVEYRRKSAKGLEQQGWKDSADSVFHRDGRVVEESVALAEVQGYVYRAKLGIAGLAQALRHRSMERRLRQEAEALRERFEQAFWCEEIGTYGIALDGEKQLCKVRSSNAGQVLWSGIADPARARRVGETLLDAASFSGWGVRTIAEGEARYNPMSYHNGSVWPHDNALIAMGLARYGMQAQVEKIFAGLFEASVFADQQRLPELFCGFVRREQEGPTLYPVACSPQAWASASVFYLLQACLGMSFHADECALRLHAPALPEFISRLEIDRLQVGRAVVDLSFYRHDDGVGVKVRGKQGRLEVAVVSA